MLGRKIIKCQQFIPILEQTARRFRYFASKISINKSNALFASSLVSACQMACRACLALGCADFGKQFSTFMVLCIQQRC